MIRNTRSAKVLAVVLGASLLAAACGDDDEGDGGAATTAAEGSATTEAESTATTQSGGASTTRGGTATSTGGTGGATTTGGGGTATSECPQQGGTMRFGAEQIPGSWNWLTAEDNLAWGAYIMQNVWIGTFLVAPDGSLSPNEALNTYEVVTEDPLVIEYTINPDANWSDGTPITAADYIYTWQAQRDDSGDSGYLPAGSNGYEDIASVEGSADGKTVTVTYSVPYADWEAVFEAVFPVANFTQLGGGDPVVGFNTGTKVDQVDPTAIVASGPYKLGSFTADQQVTLVRNESYAGTPPCLDTIVFPFITDSNQQAPALANGEVDGGYPQAQIDLLNAVREVDDAEFEVGFGSFWEHFDFNANNPILADVNVRRAIAKAIDREAIVATVLSPFDESAEVLNNRIYFPGSQNYEDHGAEYVAPDIEEARSLLEAAGYTEGANGIYEKDGQPLSLRLTWLNPANARRAQIAELVQSQVREAGIEISQIQGRPGADGWLDARDFDIALFGWTGGVTVGDTQSIYVAGGGQNFSDLAIPEVATLYEQANVETDPAARADLMNQIDEVLWENMFNLPLAQNPEIIIWRDGFENIIYNGYDGPTWNAGSWYPS